MEEKALLAVSFGTSWDDTREKTIIPTERALAASFPERELYTAYTSGMVRRGVRQRGTETMDAGEALSRMEEDGVRDVLCQPTHMLCGEEFDRLAAALRERRDGFEHVSLGRPLLDSYEDIAAVLRILSGGIPREKDEALVLMGHGTRHFCNMVYAAADYFAQRNGFRDVCVGTVEAWPDLGTLIGTVKERGFSRAVMTPLMLVAGDHANNDMAGEGPESWLSRFGAAGIEARAVVRGLGEYPEIRELFCGHAHRAAEI